MSISVKILGCNAASFAHNRHQTSQIVQVGDSYFMMDCGEATQLQCKKYGVKISKIDHILITHLHGDHYYGLMGMLSTMHLYGRSKPLVIIGPPGLADILSLQLKYSQTQLNFPIDFREWVPHTHSLVFENTLISIFTIPLNHRVPCSGYLIKEKPKLRRLIREKIPMELTPTQISSLKNGHDLLIEEGNFHFYNSEVTLPPLPSHSYAYCTDTLYTPGLREYIDHVELLYHEATFLHDLVERSHATFHTTAREAAQLAKDCHVKKLVIGHFSIRYQDPLPLLNEAKEIFNETYLAVEGLDFDTHFIKS